MLQRAHSLLLAMLTAFFFRLPLTPRAQAEAYATRSSLSTRHSPLPHFDHGGVTPVMRA
jgi:hypothetical protein